MMRGKTLLLLVTLTVVLVVAQAAMADSTNKVSLRFDSSNGGTSPDYAAGTYTFYYSLWGDVATWYHVGGLADLQYVDLAVCPWGSYANYATYAPGTSTYTKFRSGEVDYWDAVTAFKPYPYDELFTTTLPQSPNPQNASIAGWPQSGTWSNMQVGESVVSSSNLRNEDNSNGRDAYQGLVGGTGSASIFLGGFSFTATHVSYGQVPYAIYDNSGTKLLGNGTVIGPTPEASTLVLLGVTGLPFLVGCFRRRRKAA